MSLEAFSSTVNRSVPTSSPPSLCTPIALARTVEVGNARVTSAVTSVSMVVMVRLLKSSVLKGCVPGVDEADAGFVGFALAPALEEEEPDGSLVLPDMDAVVDDDDDDGIEDDGDE